MAAAAGGLPPIDGYTASVDLDSETESNHDTALTLACAGGHEELVKLLLERGADIGERCQHVTTIFFIERCLVLSRVTKLVVFCSMGLFLLGSFLLGSFSH